MAPTSVVEIQLPSFTAKGSGNLSPVTGRKAEARWRRKKPEQVRLRPEGRRNKIQSKRKSVSHACSQVSFESEHFHRQATRS